LNKVINQIEVVKRVVIVMVVITNLEFTIIMLIATVIRKIIEV